MKKTFWAIILLALCISTVMMLALPVFAQNGNETNADTAPIEPTSGFLTLENVAFIAVFLGVFGRLMFPYFKKTKDEEKLEFDYKFLATAGEAFVEGLVLVSLIFAPFLETLPVGTSMLLLFLFGFNYGWARVDINNRVLT